MRACARSSRICFPSHGSLAPVENTVSAWSLCLSLSPVALFLVPQVWYLSGWVCYLQAEKPREPREGEERSSGEESEEERRALWEAARSYLTNAKKVVQRTRADFSRSGLGWSTFSHLLLLHVTDRNLSFSDDCRSSPQHTF